MSARTDQRTTNTYDGGSGGHDALLAAFGFKVSVPQAATLPPSEIGRRINVQDEQGMLRFGYEITNPGASLAIGSRRPEGPSGIAIDDLYLVTRSGNVYHFSYRGEEMVSEGGLDTGVCWFVEKKSSGSKFKIEPDVSHNTTLTVGRPVPPNLPFQTTEIVKIVALDATRTAA